MSSPRLYFLGSTKIERDRKPVDLPAKAVALLGLLAVEREPQTRERILGLLWAESSEEAARKNLRNALWAIRKALGDEVVTSRDDRLALSDSAWVDVWEFEKRFDSRSPTSNSRSPHPSEGNLDLEPALSLFRGQLLEGLALADAPEFEIWLTGERERLAQLYLKTLGGWVETLRARGDWPGMIGAARRALAYDPLQEPMYRVLMQAHARMGERVEALREYDNLRGALERELGVAPLPETEALRAAIANGMEKSRPVVEPARAPAPTAESPAPPLVGREADLAALDEEFQKAATGARRVVLVTGEIGIGKSRLWREWSKRISRERAPNAVALEANALESTRSLPFAPLAQLFGRSELCRRLFEKESPLAPAWVAEVARLLPDLRAARPDLPPPTVLPPDEERRRVFEAFTQALLALGAIPLVVFLDDAHWADRATLDWLDYLVHRLKERPFLLVVAYRPEDAPATLVHLAASWARAGQVQRLPLERLSPQDSAALLAALGGDSEKGAPILEQSAGNPYFLIELHHAGPAEIPPALNELVRARLDGLPEAAQQVAQAAAVLEPGVEFGILRRTSGRGEEETLDALDVLLRANILVERQRLYDFSQPLVAEIVRGGLSSARRGYLHRRAAEALESAHASRLEPLAGRLARHYQLAGQTARAARYAETAAKHALTLAAPDEAVAFYRQALAAEPTPARQLGLGQVLFRQGRLTEARNEFELALSALEAAGDRRGAARAALDIAETYFPSGRFDLGKHWTDVALGYIDDQEDPAAHATAHLLLGTGTAGSPAEASEKQQHLEQAVQHASEHGLHDIAGRAHFILGGLLAEQGDLPQAVSAYRQAIVLSHRAGNEYEEILATNNLAYHALLLGDLETAHSSVERGLELAERHALRLPLQYLYSTRGEIALAEEQWDEAERWFREGLAIAEGLGNAEQAANYRANLALAARGRGDLEEALILLEDARAAAGRLPAAHLQLKIDLWLAELYRQRGEKAAFEEALARAESRLQNSGKKQLIHWVQQLRTAAASPSMR